MKKIGDTVKWANGRKPIGKVIHAFRHNGRDYVVVEKPDGVLVVCLDYAQLLTV